METKCPLTPKITNESETGTPVQSKGSRRLDPGFEALIRAFHSKDIIKVKEIINLGLSVNYREPARRHRTPLIYAAKCDFAEGVSELLSQGADPDLADATGATALHTAASNGNYEPLAKLIKVVSNIDVKDTHGRTALHCASQSLAGSNDKGNSKVVQRLLGAGALPSSKDTDGRTALHVAAFIGNVDLISLLLVASGACLVTARDKEGKTPLHHAVSGARSLITVRILLQYESPIDAKDNQGRTPLHYVAGRHINYVDEEFDGECLELLLSHGASVVAKDDDGQNALSLALQKTMWWSRCTPRDVILHAVQMLVARGSAITDGFAMWRMVETFPSLVMVALNQSIRANTSAKDSPHLKLKLDVRPLTQPVEKQKLIHIPMSPPIDELHIPAPLMDDSEISMLHYIVWSGHKHILRHPLCSAFLHLKWLRIRNYFVFNALFHFIFVLTFTGFMLTMTTCKMEKGSNETKPISDIQEVHNLPENFFTDLRHCTWLILLLFSIFFVFRELFQFINSPGIYISHYENYIDLTMIICVIMLITLPGPCLKQWQNAVGSIAAITSWSRLMLFLGHFPSCGVYIVMFSTVSKTVIRFLAIYLPLLLAFTLGFYIVLQGVGGFHTFLVSIVTSMVMMTGEIEYSNKILDNKLITSNFLAFAMLVLFILLVYIILSNLLVALAVSDMSTIQQRSELLRLTRQVELIVQGERFIKSPFIPKRLRNFLKSNLSVTGGHSDRLFSILPNRRRGITETLYSYLTRIFHNKRFLTKIFEHFVAGFIPPDPEPSLPKSLLKETTQLALTELEIEKRDKLLCSRSQQANAIRNKMGKKGKGMGYTPKIPQRPMAQYIQLGNLSESRTRAILNENWFEDPDVENFISSSRQQDGPIQSTPSLRACLWRASIRREAHLHAKHLSIQNEEASSTKAELEDLRKTIGSLQSAVESLVLRLLPSRLPFEKSPHRRSFPFQKPIRSQKSSTRFPDAAHSIQELNSYKENESQDDIKLFPNTRIHQDKSQSSEEEDNLSNEEFQDRLIV